MTNSPKEPEKKQVWYVYMLECADDTLYTGITTNLERRVKEHNTSKLGAKYTRVRRPVRLVWSLECVNRSDASKTESKLKKKTRTQKLRLIQAKAD